MFDLFYVWKMLGRIDKKNLWSEVGFLVCDEWKSQTKLHVEQKKKENENEKAYAEQKNGRHEQQRKGHYESDKKNSLKGR